MRHNCTRRRKAVVLVLWGQCAYMSEVRDFRAQNLPYPAFTHRFEPIVPFQVVIEGSRRQDIPQKQLH